MLTTAQQATLKTAVQADNVLKTLPPGPDSAYAVMTAFNLQDVSNTVVWWSHTPIDNIFNSITWANYTPNDAADGTAIYTNRTLLAITKQTNLQNMLVGRETINMTNPLTRQGLKDAVHNLPTGTGGALTEVAGVQGVTLLTAGLRPTLASRFEKLFSSGPQTIQAVTADVLVIEGQLSQTDVQQAMGW